jgi:hypothetical protein
MIAWHHGFRQIAIFSTSLNVTTAAEKLRGQAEAKAHEMAARNPSRIHLVEKLEKLVESYNLGTLDVQVFFEALKQLIAAMEEERRAVGGTAAP